MMRKMIAEDIGLVSPPYSVAQVRELVDAIVAAMPKKRTDGYLERIWTALEPFT